MRVCLIPFLDCVDNALGLVPDRNTKDGHGQGAAKAGGGENDAGGSELTHFGCVFRSVIRSFPACPAILDGAASRQDR